MAVAVTVTVFVLAGVVVGEPHGVATARMGTSARTATLLNNIVLFERDEAGRMGSSSRGLRNLLRNAASFYAFLDAST